MREKMWNHYANSLKYPKSQFYSPGRKPLRFSSLGTCFAVVLLTLLCLCSSSRMLVEESYRTASFANATMAVIVPNEDIRIDYSGDVEPEFGPGNQDSLIYAYFKRAVVERMTSETSLSDAFYASYEEPKTYMPAVKEISIRGNGIREIEIPENGTQYDLGQSADFVLIIDKLFIGTSMETNHYWASKGTFVRQNGTPYHTTIPGGPYGVNSFTPPKPPMPPYQPRMHSTVTKELVCASNIVIWDNNKGTLVAYGHVKASVGSSFIPVVVMATWERLMDDYVETIFEDTPFTHDQNY